MTSDRMPFSSSRPMPRPAFIVALLIGWIVVEYRALKRTLADFEDAASRAAPTSAKPRRSAA